MSQQSGPLSSFKSVVEYFRGLSLSHLNVKQFKFGRRSDLDIEQSDNTPQYYPLVFMESNRTDFMDGGKVLYTFTLIVADITNYELQTKEDQLNTTMMIAQDLFSRIRQTMWSTTDLKLELPVTGRCFVESFNNTLTGWEFVMKIEVMNPYNNCDAAFN
jgi:hypothetical protein